MNAISDTYRSIAAPAKGIYKELGSKFLAFAHPVETEDQAKEILAAVRKEYFDARHHCFAWRLGLTGEPYRLSDDGEPSSTAGRSIHGQLLSQELSDILVVVVRYFGGVKLGIMICYDREYPESARILMLKGAEIILVPNDCESMTPRVQALSTRAYENMCGVAMANPGGRNAGQSCAFSPICWDENGECIDNTLLLADAETEGLF